MIHESGAAFKASAILGRKMVRRTSVSRTTRKRRRYRSRSSLPVGKNIIVGWYRTQKPLRPPSVNAKNWLSKRAGSGRLALGVTTKTARSTTNPSSWGRKRKGKALDGCVQYLTVSR